MDTPHRRYNPLMDEWVLVSPHRSQRPWLGAEETPVVDHRPSYDPGCYLCPGNARAGGELNAAYDSTFVFVNDFAAVISVGAEGVARDDGLFRSQSARGECRVICFSPDHSQTLATMSEAAIVDVVRLWQEQVRELGAKYRWVQVFENHGSAMGASNPHPHGQIWATDALPTIPAREDSAQRAYYREHGRTLLGDYLAQEVADRSRIVIETDHWVWLVPFWATWPFEVMLMPKREVGSLIAITGDEARDLAAVLKRGLTGYDRLFQTDFPYSMGWHGEAVDDAASGWHLHAHFYPPLLRSANVRKYMVGFEMLGEAQRDLTPEQAADRLRISLS